MKPIQFAASFIILILIFSGITISAQNTAKKTGLNKGNIAPELIGTDPEGNEIKLSDLRGKVVLIDFWASWCGPCRRENPNVVSAYSTFKNKDFKNGTGFTVFGVSLDKSKTMWKKAIEKDNLTWPYHISDLKGWYSKHAAKYRVRSIPKSYLIDGDGVIIAINPRGPMLDKQLELQLK